MDVKQLKYFMAIVEEGQITRAARRLHMAQPPLSYQLKQLEEELGLQLVERSNKKLKLTEAGRALYHRAEQITGLVESTAREMKEFDAGVRGTLALGSTVALGAMFLPDKIQEFNRHYPEVRFQWSEGPTYRILELLESRVIEIGIVRLPVDVDMYEQISLPGETWGIATNDKKHAKSRDGVVRLADLAGESFLLIRRQQGAYCYDAVVDACREAGFEPRVFCESDNPMALLALAAAGLGIAIVPKSVIALVPDKKLRFREIVEPTVESKTAVIWLRNQHLSIAAERFLDMYRDKNRLRSP